MYFYGTIIKKITPFVFFIPLMVLNQDNWHFLTVLMRFYETMVQVLSASPRVTMNNTEWTGRCAIIEF